MTLYTKSAIVTGGVIAAFLILMAFNYGRLTASQITLRSSCELTSEDRDGLRAAWYAAKGGRS
jgi:hypothetical protein